MPRNAFPLVIGTHNVAKGRELVQLLGPHGFEIQTLADFPYALEVAETGTTFAKNARKKAVEQAKYLKQWVLADDSGIEVEALQGAPGVYSARYAGPQATDQSNNDKLLMDLSELPPEKRGARYYCHIALADPQGTLQAESTGHCHGRIRRLPAGTNGFGYDPLFEIRELHRTFGELGPRVKAALSHRARALRAIVPKLITLVETGKWNE